MKRLYRRFIALLAVLLLGSCLFTASAAAKTFTHIEETDGSVTCDPCEGGLYAG